MHQDFGVVVRARSGPPSMNVSWTSRNRMFMLPVLIEKKEEPVV